MGVPITEKDEVVTLINGLSPAFDWFKNFLRLDGAEDSSASFDYVSKIALDFAADKKLLKSSTKKGTEKKSLLNVSESTKKKHYCFDFNASKGCTRKDCRYLHEKIPDSERTGYSNNE